MGGSRLDLAVSNQLKVCLEEAAALIDFGSVYVEGRVERDPSRMLTGGEEIVANVPSYGTRKYYELDPARIIYRDKFILAYDKEPGIPSQPTPFDGYNNVFSALRRYLAKEKPGNTYAGLHHRLDTETSGVMLFALAESVNRVLGTAFQEKRIRREYLAFIEGDPKSDRWDTELRIDKRGNKYGVATGARGKEARTAFRVMKREQSRTLVLATPFTGRTHQIRIHLAAAGHPIVGDRTYGAKPDTRLYLHALRISMHHPTQKRAIIISTPVPPDFSIPPDFEAPSPDPF